MAEYLEVTPSGERIAVAGMYGDLALLSGDGRLIASGEFPQERFRRRYGGCSPRDRLAVSADARTVIFVHCEAYVWRME